MIVPKPVQFVLLSVYLLYLLKDNWKEIKLDKISILILAYTGVHAISIVFAVFRGFTPERLFAAINTCLIWVVAVGLYAEYSQASYEAKDIPKYCFFNATFMIVLSLLARVMHAFGMDAFGIPYIGILFKIDEPYPYSRLNAFLDYPTLVVPFMLIMIPGAMEYLKHKMEAKKKERVTGIVQVSYYGMCGLPIYFSYSRAGYVLYLAGILLLLGYLFGKKLSKKQVIMGIAAAGLIVVVLACATPLLENIVAKLMSMRGGSNSTRMIIYTETIQAFFRHPVIGCGIKEMCKGAWLYPLGSHSTYLGFLYKTGIVGTSIVMLAFLKCAINLGKTIIFKENEKAIYASSVLMILAFACFEDLDGADWLVCLLFIIFGVINKDNN